MGKESGILYVCFSGGGGWGLRKRGKGEEKTGKGKRDDTNVRPSISI